MFRYTLTSFIFYSCTSCKAIIIIIIIIFIIMIIVIHVIYTNSNILIYVICNKITLSGTLLCRQLYWTNGNSIVQSSLMGENPVTIFTTTTLDCTFALSLNERLYWTENCFGTNVSSVRLLNLTTHAESIIVESDTIHPYFGVTAFNGSVFWTGIAAVHTATIENGTDSQIYRNTTYGTQFRGIVIVDPSLQPDNRTIAPTSTSTGMTTTLLVTPTLPGDKFVSHKN